VAEAMSGRGASAALKLRIQINFLVAVVSTSISEEQSNGCHLLPRRQGGGHSNSERNGTSNICKHKFFGLFLATLCALSA
jgi:hypothetical protein